MIFIAALMVDLGKVRYQPADAQDEQDLEIADKASTIQAFNERKNKIAPSASVETALFVDLRLVLPVHAVHDRQEKVPEHLMTPQYENEADQSYARRLYSALIAESSLPTQARAILLLSGLRELWRSARSKGLVRGGYARPPCQGGGD